MQRWTLAAAIVLAACSSDSPTAPTPVPIEPIPSPPQVADVSGIWEGESERNNVVSREYTVNLLQTGVSVAGAGTTRDPLGLTADVSFQLDLTVSGSRVTGVAVITDPPVPAGCVTNMDLELVGDALFGTGTPAGCDPAFTPFDLFLIRVAT